MSARSARSDAIGGLDRKRLNVGGAQHVGDQLFGTRDVRAVDIGISAEAPCVVLWPPTIGQHGQRLRAEHRAERSTQQEVPALGQDKARHVARYLVTDRLVALPEAEPTAFGAAGVPGQDADQMLRYIRRGATVGGAVGPQV